MTVLFSQMNRFILFCCTPTTPLTPFLTLQINQKSSIQLPQRKKHFQMPWKKGPTKEKSTLLAQPSPSHSSLEYGQTATQKASVVNYGTAKMKHQACLSQALPSNLISCKEKFHFSRIKAWTGGQRGKGPRKLHLSLACTGLKKK